MALVNMKRSKQEIKEQSKPVGVGVNEYPYGLQLNLDDDEIDKLPGTETLQVDDYVVIKAIGKVTRVASNDISGGDKRRDLGIQIEKLDISLRDDEEAAFKEANKEKE